MSRADEVIADAQKRAETIVGNAKREALIRRSLEDSHPDIPQPRSVFFASARDPEAWLSWPEAHYRQDPRPTVAQYWNEGLRILSAFDWQTLAHATDSFTHVGPEDTIPKGAEIVRTFDVVLTIEGGDDRRPSAEVHVWTELAPHLNEGFFRIEYEFPADMLPRALRPTPRYVDGPGKGKRRDGWDESAIRGFEQDRIKWWSSGPSEFRWSYLFTSAGWDAFAEFVSAELGD